VRHAIAFVDATFLEGAAATLNCLGDIRESSNQVLADFPLIEDRIFEEGYGCCRKVSRIRRFAMATSGVTCTNFCIRGFTPSNPVSSVLRFETSRRVVKVISC
jgi:hypothetical protein